MKTIDQFAEHREMTHALDALPLMAFWNIRTDEWKGNAIKLVAEHRVDVIDEFAWDAVLVGDQTYLQMCHGPFDGWPMEGGETCADAKRALIEPATSWAGRPRPGAVAPCPPSLSLT